MLRLPATFPGSDQTCVASPAQQRSDGPKHRSRPDAEEGHADGVHADTMGCRDGHKSGEQCRDFGKVNVDGAGKCRAEEVRGPQTCSILSLWWMSCDIYWTTGSFLNSSEKECLLSKLTLSRRKKNDWACFSFELKNTIIAPVQSAFHCVFHSFLDINT